MYRSTSMQELMSNKPEWVAAIEKEYSDRLSKQRPSQFLFPLIQRTYGMEEVIAMTKVVLSGQLTMSDNVRRFEAEFAAYVNCPYAVMVNSGSSANLLALAALVNKVRQRHLNTGDEVLVPAVCWSTTLAPILQLGLKPVLVDVDPATLNIDLADVRRKITANTRAMMIVHVLGNCAPMGPLMEIVNQHNLLLIEDTCESLGSRYNGKMLGTFGAFGSYSFYYSHHLTTGEGGMVTCNTLEDYDLLRCLRAHGWTRELSNRPQLEKQYPDVDPRFLFVNTGFNFRPMEIQAAMGSVQLVRLPYMNSVRNLNRDRIIRAYQNHAKFSGQFSVVKSTEQADPAWFGFCVTLSSKYEHQLKEYLTHLTAAGIENRPIISGNFARQPLVRDLFPGITPRDFPGADTIGSRGFFIGLHVEPLSESSIETLVEALLSFEFRAANLILVTGGYGVVGRALQDVVNAEPKGADESQWVFLRRSDGDLRELSQAQALFDKHRPTHVIHLAVTLKSSQGLGQSKVEMWEDNMAINNNILRCARQHGVRKVVSLLSPMAYPNDPSAGGSGGLEHRRLSEATLHLGPPTTGVDTYGYAKRMLEVLSRAYREQYGCNFVTVLPTNVFGPGAAFRPDGPVIEGCISKVLQSKEQGTPLAMYGSGKPLRQFIYSGDLARLLIWALHHYDDAETINFPGEELSIAEVVDKVTRLVDFKGEVKWDASKPDGPLRRTLDDEKLRKLVPDWKPTPFDEVGHHLLDTNQCGG
eukprot:TRINITY_DN273_c0_g1_i6.p1 TRINITY_DN273_c0_g1~~TRINITY_DN273_c0_g1_i6.p1  ORF type:complete len:785 (+),score=320.56 TRINITY_DN273_c0_g1_i6:102-2357(+)